MKRDLTKGGIYKNLWIMSVPTMIGFTAQMVYDLVDIFWIGKISGSAVAGVTIFSTLFWLLSTLNDIIGQSSVSLISQKYGNKDIKGTNLAIEQTITFKCFMALISMVVFVLFIRPMVGFFTTEKAVIDSAMDYGYIRLFFLPIMFSSYSVNTALRCIGDAKTPMIIMFVTSIINIVLDPLLMFSTIPGTNIPGLGMGVFGAGLATVISQTTAFLIGFIYLFSGKAHIKPSIKGLFKLDWSIDKKLLTIGLPNGIQAFLRNLSGAAIMKFVSMYGTSVVASVGVGNRIFGLAFMPLVGIEMGSGTIIGQNLGAEKVERAEKTAHASAIVSVIFMAIFTLICWLFGDQIIACFNNDSKIVLQGAEYLRYGSLGLIALAVGFGLSPVFGGSGYNMPFVVASLISRWVIQIPLLFLFINVLKLGTLWVWLSYVFGDIVESAIYIVYYRIGKWKQKRVY